MKGCYNIYIPHSSTCEHCNRRKQCALENSYDKRSELEIMSGLNRKKKRSRSKVKVNKKKDNYINNGCK